MGQIRVSRQIRAPLKDVFETVSDIRCFSKAVPQITKVRILTDDPLGVGTRFRETRVVDGKHATTELEVTEFVANERIRLIADSHGTVWDSLFQVRESGEEHTTLTLTMESRPYKLFPMLLYPFIKTSIENAVKRDMDAVKSYCEAPG